MNNLWRVTPLVVLALAGTAFVASLFELAGRMDQDARRDQIASEAAAARTNERRVADAQRFLVEQAKSQRYTFRISQPLEVPAARNPANMTFPVQADTGATCRLSAEAYGDLAAQVVWMRPTQLECGGEVRAVNGAIRRVVGQVIAGQITIETPIPSVRTSGALELAVWLAA